MNLLLDPGHHGFDDLGSLLLPGPACHIRESVAGGIQTVEAVNHEGNGLNHRLAFVPTAELPTLIEVMTELVSQRLYHLAGAGPLHVDQLRTRQVVTVVVRVGFSSLAL